GLLILSTPQALTISLHDALPISEAARQIAIGVMARRTAECVGRVLPVDHELSRRRRHVGGCAGRSPGAGADRTGGIDRVPAETRSEEHTSELQSRGHLGCRRLLE